MKVTRTVDISSRSIRSNTLTVELTASDLTDKEKLLDIPLQATVLTLKADLQVAAFLHRNGKLSDKENQKSVDDIKSKYQSILDSIATKNRLRTRK